MLVDNLSGTAVPALAGREKRRRYPRVSINSPFEIMLKDGFKVHAIARDISEDGIQVRCDRATACRMHPSGRHIRRDDRPEVIVRLALPVRGVAYDLVAVCHIYYFALCDDGGVAFGLRFKTFARDGARMLDAFIEECLMPMKL